MKKALSILLALMLLLTLCACGNDAPSTEPETNTPSEEVTVPSTEVPTECTHAYTEAVTKEATCKEEGIKTYACSGCGDCYTESIAKVAHNWKDATCTAPRVCSVCRSTEGERIAHNYVNGTCSSCGNIPTIDSATADALLLNTWTGYVSLDNGAQYVGLEFGREGLFIAHFDPLEYETEGELQEILTSGNYKGDRLHWLKQFNGSYYHSFGGGGGFSYTKELDGNILYIRLIEFDDGGTLVFNVLSDNQIVLKETYGVILPDDDIADYEGVIFTIGSVGD